MIKDTTCKKTIQDLRSKGRYHLAKSLEDHYEKNDRLFEYTGLDNSIDINGNPDIVPMFCSRPKAK